MYHSDDVIDRLNSWYEASAWQGTKVGGLVVVLCCMVDE